MKLCKNWKLISINFIPCSGHLNAMGSNLRSTIVHLGGDGGASLSHMSHMWYHSSSNGWYWERLVLIFYWRRHPMLWLWDILGYDMTYLPTTKDIVDCIQYTIIIYLNHTHYHICSISRVSFSSYPPYD
jgi:hypothetical protein